ncbi:MAG TPA: hypothetical protein VKI65_06485 [Gemmataceae bacterium]|nr:hypothetical protein [Gemmataceae bacterium]
MGLNVSGSSIPPPGWWKKYAVLVAAVVGALLALDFLVSWVRFGVFAAQAASPGAPAELFVSVLDTIIYHRTADRLEDFYVQTRLWSLGVWLIFAVSGALWGGFAMRCILGWLQTSKKEPSKVGKNP